ncbi:MAG: response regulator [Candidatus Vogelbacteria bacterium]|nr:response regulator [Candidatus Vogelbacteria bacterium]
MADEKKVLLVEDDKFLRETLAKKLITNGLVVQAAIDGKNALEILKTFTPNLVLLDLLLPDIDGFTVLQEMKKDPKFTPVPVIVLSNLDKPDDMQKAKGLGAKDFMVKSNFTLNEIVNRAKATLGIV